MAVLEKTSAQRDEEESELKKHTVDDERLKYLGQVLPEPDELCCDNALLMVPFIQSCYAIFALQLHFGIF